MDLSKYDGKHVRVTDTQGNVFTGCGAYLSSEYCLRKYGAGEDGVLVEGYPVYASGIASIQEIGTCGTAELPTERLLLRRYRPEDAEDLYEYFGKDPAMFQYSGWNPYATPEMAQETVRRFIDSYDDDHTYSWVMDIDDVVVGTIGAYDYEDGRIEVGFSVVPGWQGRGLATEALKKVLEYLTINEDISCVTAWCASENTASRRALEKAGMKLVRTEQDGLTACGSTYDKLFYEYNWGLMFSEFEFNGEPDTVITEVGGLELPRDYLTFMKKHDGGEGPLGENNYGRFYKLEELEEINKEYDVRNSWPGYVVLGGIDDALWAYNPDKKIFCQIDSCNTDDDTYYTISDSFASFLTNMDKELE